MNIQEFLNISPNEYSTYKKTKYLLKKASNLEQTPEVKAKIKEIELYLKYLAVNDFFPTPKKVADIVLQCTNFIYSGFNILEPSAGTGNLADVIKAKYTAYTNDVNLDCVEINYELAEHLKSLGYKVFNCDFLKFKANKKYDLIIMNPPSKDLLNLLNKALELLKSNGQLLCIIPSLAKTKYKKFIDKTGALYYDNLNFDFTEAKSGCICQLLEINMQAEKQTRLLTTKLLDGVTYKEMTMELSIKLDKLELEKEKIKEIPKSFTYYVENLLELCKDAPSLWKSATPLKKRELLKIVCSNLQLKDKK